MSFLAWLKRGVEPLLDRAVPQSWAGVARDAKAYWNEAEGDRWEVDSHWRGSSAFTDDEQWLDIGRDHLAMFRRLAPATWLAERGQLERVVEWGVGGGTNAIAFADLAREFVGVDVVTSSLDETGRQLSRESSVTYVPVLADLDSPETAATEIGPTCDLFVCFYVLELVPSPEYGLRVMRAAFDVLRPGGLAFVQIKYRTADWRTRARVRRYRANLANVTTYAIHEFWQAAQDCGFVPHAVALVPKNRLDERYAYFVLTRP